MLQFEHPDILSFLVLIPVLAVLFFAVHRWRKVLLGRFASSTMLGHLAPGMSTGKRSLKQMVFLMGAACLIVALANPRVGTRLEEVKREGIDLFVALDVSLSMKAEDIRPSRLEKAKRDVSLLLRKLAGDRVGLIVFAGEAFVQFPLTSDYSAADLFISAIDVDVVPTPGTAIGSAVRKALQSFAQDVPTQKAIIIVSDGENTEGTVMEVVEEAAKAGVKIYTVGMGTPDGGPIPVFDAAGQRVDYKRDQRGTVVITRLDETTLQQIAAMTGGSYRRATSAGNEIDAIFDELAALEKVEFGVKQVSGYETVYQYPLALALLLLLVELLLSEQRGTVLIWLRRFLPAPAVVIAAALATGVVQGQTHRDVIREGNKAYADQRWSDAEAEYKKALQRDAQSREALFNLGDAYYRQERYDEAIRSFAAYEGLAARGPDDASKAFYNIGNARYQSNRFEESVEAYKQALRLNPADDDARYNLQMAMEKLKNQQQQQQQQNQDQQREQDQRQQQERQNQQQQEQQRQQDQRQQQNDRQQPRQQESEAARQQRLPPEQAERILEALRNSEREIQKQIRKREGIRIKTEKDW